MAPVVIAFLLPPKIIYECLLKIYTFAVKPIQA